MTPKPPARPPSTKGYQCQDCSFRSAKGFPGGCCPGCGSFNIKKLGQADAEDEKPTARRNLRLVLLILLWVYLMLRIWDVWQRMN